jgi:hypothetical protein
MGDDEDATNMTMVHIQESNNFSTKFLLCNDCDGNAFKDTTKKVSRKSVMGGKRRFEKEAGTNG